MSVIRLYISEDAMDRRFLKLLKGGCVEDKVEMLDCEHQLLGFLCLIV